MRGHLFRSDLDGLSQGQCDALALFVQVVWFCLITLLKTKASDYSLVVLLLPLMCTNVSFAFAC